MQHCNYIQQDRRWNAEQPSATLDPQSPTWLTTSPTNHRLANFWKTFFKLKKNLKSDVISVWTDIENPYHLLRGWYLYLYMYIFVSISLPLYTEWSIIEKPSKRRRLCTFLISRGQKTHVQHCYVDFSSWYDLWFAISAPNWKWWIIVFQNSQYISSW